MSSTASAHAGAHADLGMIYAKRNDFPAARNELERAVELDPKNLTAHYQHSLVYARLGDKERSRAMSAIAERLRSEQHEEETTGLKLIDQPQ